MSRQLPALHIDGTRPASYSSAGEAAWKLAIRDEVRAKGLTIIPRPAVFGMRVEFRLPEPVTANDRWDLDNLLKPTMDALDDVLGVRQKRGRPETDDERIAHVEAWKRDAHTGEEVGATIELWVV